MNFVKFLRTPFLTEHIRWLLLGFQVIVFSKVVAGDEVGSFPAAFSLNPVPAYSFQEKLLKIAVSDNAASLLLLSV